MPNPTLASVRVAELFGSGHRETARERQVKAGPRVETRTPTRASLYVLATLIKGTH